MQRQLSPWREMRWRRDEERRLDYAKVVVAAPAMLGLLGLTIAAVMTLSHRASVTLPVARVALPLVATYLLFALQLLAAWAIGQRRAVGGYLALALFSYGIALAAWRGRLLSVGVGYDVLAMWLVIDIAPVLGLHWPSAVTRARSGRTRP